MKIPFMQMILTRLKKKNVTDTEENADDEAGHDCFYCEKYCITRKGRKILCIRSKDKVRILHRIKKYATEMNDLDMLLKIQAANENDTTHLYYHSTCQTSYFGKFSNKQTKAKTNTQETIRNIHKIARERLFQYVEEEIINNKKVFSLTYLKHCFVTFLEELHEIAGLESDSLFHLYNIKAHLEKQFKKNICCLYLNKKLYFISAQINIHDASDEEIRQLLFEREAAEFALKYRSHLLNIKSQPLPEYLNNEAIQKGECEIPRWLRLFWTIALSGMDDKHNDRIDRLASNFSQDSI